MPISRASPATPPRFAWPPEHHGKRTIIVYTVGRGTVFKLLEGLTGGEIDSRMP